MFDNIVANNEINFNELEKKIYKFVCDLGCNLLKEIIERYDVKLQNERDKKNFRHRGLKTDSIKNRMNGSKCHGCMTKNVTIGFNDLKTVAPELVLEWDYEKNIDIKPEQVTCCSNKKVWWKCERGHSWQSVISSRYYGCKCPYCMNRKVLTGFNDLETINPTLALEWDYETNGAFLPSTVLAGSNQKYGWICKKGHRWKATVESRNHRHYGCPFCAGKNIGKETIENILIP